MTTKRKVLKKVRRTGKNPYLVSKLEIDVSQLLLHSRQLFLYKEIDSESADDIIKRLHALAEISNDPIILWINSDGGTVSDGFAIIDTIRLLQVPIFTIINGRACSMAGLILLAGDRRAMTENSIFMAHELTAGNFDYAQKMLDRAEFYKELNKRIITFLATNTKMTQEDLEKAQRGELWLNADQCLQKGIVTGIVKGSR